MTELQEYALKMSAELVKSSLSDHAHHPSKEAGKRIADMFEIVYRKIYDLASEEKTE